MAKFCGKCGNPIEQGNLFCSHCGAKIESETPKESFKNSAGRTVKSASQNAAAAMTQKKWLPMVAVLAVVAVVGVVAFFLMNRSNYEQINNEQNGNFLIDYQGTEYLILRGNLYRYDGEEGDEQYDFETQLNRLIVKYEHGGVGQPHVVNNRLYYTDQQTLRYVDLETGAYMANDVKIPNDDSGSYYKCDDQYVYYYSTKSQSIIRAPIFDVTKSSEELSKTTEIATFYPNKIIPVGNKLYLTRSDFEYSYKQLAGEKGFWVMNKDGSELKQLYEEYPRFVLFDGNRVYLCYEDDVRKSHLISMKQDGSDVKEIDKSCPYISSVNICNGEIFYTEGDGKTNAFDGQMHKIDKQGNDSVVLSDLCLSIEVIDGMLYFYDSSKGGDIYRMKPNGSDLTLAYKVK